MSAAPVLLAMARAYRTDAARADRTAEMFDDASPELPRLAAQARQLRTAALLLDMAAQVSK